MEYQKPGIEDFGSIAKSTFTLKLILGKDYKLCKLDKWLGDSCGPTP